VARTNLFVRDKFKWTEGMREEIEKLSRAVSLTVFELDLSRDVLIPAYLLANLMSPPLWKWRIQRRAFASDGTLLSCKTRLSELQRHFQRYTHLLIFSTNPEKIPGGFFTFLRKKTVWEAVISSK